LPPRPWAAWRSSISNPPPTNSGSPASTSSPANSASSSRAGLHPPRRPFRPTQHAAKAQIPGAALEAAELQAVARLANDVAAWQALLQSPPARILGRLPGLSASFHPALTTSLRPLAESIERTIQPDGTLADNASPELHRIRRDQERQQRQIEESLRAALRKLSSDGATQEDLITIRGDRFVIPVRAELKRRISGVVHGASSSGQTVYVEPLETIEQNNELVRLIEEEQAEIHRIFVALTRQVGTYAQALVEGARVLALVDSLQARARFARDYDCVAPAIAPDLLRLEPPAIRCSKSASAPPAGHSSRSRWNSRPRSASSSSAAPTPAAKPLPSRPRPCSP
jgi:DNA mismatch repair protein MutS2